MSSQYLYNRSSEHGDIVFKFKMIKMILNCKQVLIALHVMCVFYHNLCNINQFRLNRQLMLLALHRDCHTAFSLKYGVKYIVFASMM